jgi:hypothetical protein
MSSCKSIRGRFSAWLDGDLTGTAMQSIAAHLDACGACAEEFHQWRESQQLLAQVGPARAPADLGLRIRVAISQEHARTARNRLAIWKVRWQNTVAPFLLQASAGLASTIVLAGTMAFLIGAFAAPESASARDETASMATSPQFLYSTVEASTGPLSQKGRPVTIEVFVNTQGEVYDYHIVSGPSDPATRADIETLLLSSVFKPAERSGHAVRGVALLSFSGVSVQG